MIYIQIQDTYHKGFYMKAQAPSVSAHSRAYVCRREGVGSSPAQ